MLETKNNEFGLQPMDALMVKLNLTNNDLVRVSTNQLTHKMVAKARCGRRITSNIKNKIVSSLKVLQPELKITFKDLFNYQS